MKIPTKLEIDKHIHLFKRIRFYYFSGSGKTCFRKI